MPRFGTVSTQYFDSAGDPLANGLLYIYESGTTTLKTTYADVNLTIANTNPVVLEADGRQPNIFFDGSAKIILTDSNYVQITQLDPVGGDSGTQFEAWSTIIVYSADAFVIGSDGKVYKSLAAGNQNNDPTTSPASWEEVVILGVWNTNITYAVNDLVQGSDGNLYRAVLSQSGNNPIADSGTNWESAAPEPFVVGDVMISANAAEHAAPEWLPCDGLEFDGAVYPELAALLGDWFKKLADPADLADFGTGTSGRPVSFSATDDTYCAVGHSASPFVTIYKRSGDTFTKLSDPATLPTGYSRNCDFDSTDVYLAVAHDNSPYITIYKRSGDVFTKLANPATLPAGNGRGARFSPSSDYLSVTCVTSPYMAVYSRSGDVFTKLANPATLPTGTGQDTCVDSTDTYFMIAHQTSPFISIYSRSGSTLTKLADPATLPPGSAFACDVDSTDTYWAVGSNVSPYLTIYKKTGASFTKIDDANISEFPTAFVRSVHFDGDDNLYAAFASDIYKYERAGDVFTKKKADFVTTDDVGTINGVDTSQSGNYAALGGDTTPYIAFYKDGTYVTPNIDVDANDHAGAYVRTGE